VLGVMLGFQAYTIPESTLSLLTESAREAIGVQNLRPYLPVYERFFNLDSNSRLSTSIRSKFLVNEFQNCDGCQDAKTLCDKLWDSEKDPSSGAPTAKDVFCKICPLVDPLDYVLGEVPALEAALAQPTGQCRTGPLVGGMTESPHNRAYTDAFFVYLSSRLRNNYGFVNGLQYYGAFTGIKEGFKFDFADDISEPWESESFMEGIDNRFTLDAEHLKEGFMRMKAMAVKECGKKPPLGEITLVNGEISGQEPNLGIEELEPTLTNTTATPPSHSLALGGIEEVVIFPDYAAVEKLIEPSDKGSGASDRTSVTTVDECSPDSGMPRRPRTTNSHPSGDDEADEGSEWSDVTSNEDSNDECSEYDREGSSGDNPSDMDSVSESAWCTIPKIAVAVIAQERLSGTLEELMDKGPGLMAEEWRSCLFQVCANLHTYNKVFDFVHNDLHAANIMWTPTDSTHIQYTIDQVEYTVPTFGRIFKIIDFGRATYRFGGLSFLNDCFEPERDAATQYNYDRIYDDSRPLCEPNYAFDLCRLACSIYDFFDSKGCYDHDENNDENSDGKHSPATNQPHPLAEIASLVESWCLDDTGKNILYKESGTERYPGFKLYRMIARKVSKHVPLAALQGSTFASYRHSQDEFKDGNLEVDIDSTRKEYYKS
jgi:hypothetical protein